MNLIEFLIDFTGLSLREIAERLELNYNTAFSYKQNQSKISQKILVKIHNEFGISWTKIGEFLK